ncbi:MAG: hypothetical protein HRT47_09085 [Candidatus Caenarcaniphilales bacterium]|nr:hypothetical protein [Candidatus Caenarcaniphilales bacterium]
MNLGNIYTVSKKLLKLIPALLLCLTFFVGTNNFTSAKSEEIKLKKRKHRKYIYRVPRGILSDMQYSEEAHFQLAFITPKVREYLKSRDRMPAEVPYWDKSEDLTIYVIPVKVDHESGRRDFASYSGGAPKKFYFKDKKNDSLTCLPETQESIPLKGDTLEYMYRTYWITDIADSYVVDIDHRGVIPFLKTTFTKNCLSKLAKPVAYLESEGTRNNLGTFWVNYKKPIVIKKVTTVSKARIKKSVLEYLFEQF